MNSKSRILTVILAGILVGLVAVRLQRSAGSLDRSLVSLDDATRRSAYATFQGLSGDRRNQVVKALGTVHTKNADPRVRVFALYALRRSGLTDRRVVEPLVQGLKDKDENVRKEATVGLVEIGTPGLGALIGLMKDPAVRGAVSEMVRTLPPESIPQLQGELGRDLPQQRAAAFVLSRIQRPDTLDRARETLPTLTAMLTSTDTVLAVNAAFAVHAIDSRDPRPTPVFISSLRKPKWDAWDVRGWDALDALVAMPAQFPTVAPLLRQILPTAEDGLLPERRFRRPAIGEALHLMSPRDPSIAGRVADMKSKDPVIRWLAVYEVSRAPTVDLQYMGPLVGLLGDPDTNTAGRAFYALDRLGIHNTERAAATVWPKLIDTFERVGGSLPGFWIMAAKAIGGLGQPAVPLVLKAVKEKKLELHKASIILRNLPIESAPVDALTTGFKSRDQDVSLVAATGLAKFAPDTEGLRDVLQEGLAVSTGAFKSDLTFSISRLKKS